MKKRTFFKALIALMVLSAMLLSALLGVTKAEYFKSFSKKLSLEIKPDLVLEYYLYDSENISSTSANDLKGDFGSYKNAESFTQEIVIGQQDYTMMDNNDSGKGNDDKVYHGKRIVYQIKIPVTETGYYVLDFTSEFIKLDSNGNGPQIRDTYMEQGFYTTSYRQAVGCEVLNVENTNNYQTLKFGTPTVLDLASRVFDNKVFYEKQGYTADSAFQWKTLNPGRSENVKLSFKVNKEDVDNGYVVWMWELTGLRGDQKFLYDCEHLEIEKIMELDGSMSKRDSDAPYFMTPKTTVTNAQIRIINKVSEEEKNAGADGSGNDERRGSIVPGKTSYSDGRGTYVTEATANSIGLRVETLNSGVAVQTVNNKRTTTWYYDNPTSFQIPIKNIKYDTTYKVTFDFSVARQGGASPSQHVTSSKIGSNSNNMWDYVQYDRILNRTDLKPEFNTDCDDDEKDGTKRFFSYIHDDIASLDNNKNVQTINGIAFNATRITGAEHETGAEKLYYKYKQHQGAALTKYSGILDYAGASAGHNYLDMVTSTTVNDTYSIDYFNSGEDLKSTFMRNHFNAIQHTEVNGQVAINWLTFYNTTFSFNIPKSQNGNIDLDNLNWVWAIDALEYECFYNIRIDNIRIQEVVEYSSKIQHGGVKIADKLTDVTIDANNYGQGHGEDAAIDSDSSVFNNFKGYNNIGQNYQAKRNATKSDGTIKHMSVGNIYAPIFDAKRLSAKAEQRSDDKENPDDYKLRLSGWAVLNGGVSKYVFSVDGGYTWYDMTFEGTTDNTIFAEAQEGIHQNTYLQSYENYGKGATHDFYFEGQDALNDNFGDFALTADLKDFKNQSNLDIIIAAVPYVNDDLRCEIIRIINYNAANTYVSKLETITSDIETSTGILTVTNSMMSLNNSVSGTSASFASHLYPVFERGSFDNKFAGNGGGTALGQEGAMILTEKIDYATLKTTYSDIPVKKTLTLNGAILCAGGVYSYEYSIDGGKNWLPCTYTMTGFVKDTDYVEDETLDKPYEPLFYKFLTRSTGNKPNYFRSDGGNFTTNAISIDLSAHTGKVVDVIVAAKANYLYNTSKRYKDDAIIRKTDIYLPIAKIDNVAVYGAEGTFYTEIHGVYVNPDISKTVAENASKLIAPTYLGVDGTPLNRVTKSTSDSSVTVTPQWDLGYSAKDGKQFSYTIFEPNNVNILHTRFYNDEVNVVPSGANIYIRGLTSAAKKLDAKHYKYTLDSGKTWSYVNIGHAADTTSTNPKKSDNTLINGAGGEYTFGETDTKMGRGISINLPALPNGAQRNLLVVATSEDGKNMYPVLHMKIQIEDDNVGYSLFDATKTTMQGGYYTNKSLFTQNLTVGASASNMTYKMTFPVSQEGMHTLTFNAGLELANKPVTSTSTNRTIYQALGNDTGRDGSYVKPVGTATMSMTVAKTDFYDDEPIYVTYSATNVKTNNNSKTGGLYSYYGVFYDVALAIVALDDNGNLMGYNNDQTTGTSRPGSIGKGSWYRAERVCWAIVNGQHSGKEGYSGNFTHYPSYDQATGCNLRAGRDGAAVQANGAPVGTTRVNLPAGRYRIYFINDIHIGTGNVVSNSASSNGVRYGLLQLTDPIDITIHAREEVPTTATLVHEDIESDATVENRELYYANVSKYASDNAHVDSVNTKVVENAYNATTKTYDSTDVEIYFNATAEDVRRGYVVLDWDLSSLAPGGQYKLVIKDLIYNCGLNNTKKLTTDSGGSAKHSITVPIDEGAVAGQKYNFAFAGYTQAHNPVVHKGINQTVATADVQKGGNYKSAGAYMSVPKTVYTVGEPIHVSYNSAGSGDGYNWQGNDAWIGITIAVDGRDAVVGWTAVEKDTVGAVTLTGGMGGCEDVAKQYENLPAGTYKIYFRDDMANIYRSTVQNANNNQGDDWPEMNITDPIVITIVDPDKDPTVVNPYNVKCYYNQVKYYYNNSTSNLCDRTGWISIPKTTFYANESITFNTSDKGNGAGLWLALREPNSSDYIVYTWPNEPKQHLSQDLVLQGIVKGLHVDRKDKEPASVQRYDVPPGNYQLIYLQGNTIDMAQQTGAILAIIDITILPAQTEDNTPTVTVVANNDTDNPLATVGYTYERNSVSLTLTEQNIADGYVTFDFYFLDMPANSNIVYTTKMFEDLPYDGG